MLHRKQKNIQAFTLVELIVVVTILAILSTIGFVSYSSYLTGVRDTNRLAQLVSIHDGLELYRTKNDLPLPDDNVGVIIGAETIAYQGYAGVNTLETIDFTKGGKDPKDDNYFTYYLTKDRKYFQLMAFLEEESGITSQVIPFPDRGGSEGGLALLDTAQAADYGNRIPTVFGKKLGILTDTENTPIQEISTINSVGSLTLTDTTTDYIAHLTDEDTLGDNQLLSINPKGSCKRIKQLRGGSQDGVYTINPTGADGAEFEVYCDMTTDGGGWTFLWKNFGGPEFANYGTPVSNTTLLASSSDSKLAQPHSVSGAFGSEKNVLAYDFFKDAKGMDLIKITHGYDSELDLSTNTNYTNLGVLDLGEGVTFSDIMDITSCKTLANQVELIYNGQSLGKTDKTNQRNTSQTIGLASDIDASDGCGEDSGNLMTGYRPRHFISYNHSSVGMNTVRCQERCWDGAEGIVQEVVWGIR